jgi:hypothetical protein
MCDNVLGRREARVNYGMPRPSKAERAELAKYVLDERTARTRHGDPGARGSSSEDSGMSYGGRPRNPKKRRRTPVSVHDAHYTWRG